MSEFDIHILISVFLITSSMLFLAFLFNEKAKKDRLLNAKIST
jgi:hypothetical protein